MSGLWNNVAGLAVTPVAVWALATGFGLLVERLTRARVPNALLIPIGFCASVIVALGAYETQVGDALTVPVVLVLAVLGFVLARRELPGRLNMGWPLFAGVAVYLLFDLTVIATGHWSFTGYNFDNDSAYELVLISHLQAHGTQAASGTVSGANTVVSAYLGTGYPLGAQSLLAAISGTLGVPAIVIWQGFISAMAGVGAIAASTLSGRTFDRRLAAVVGFLALASALFYQYALQGSIKEVGVAVAVLAALATIRHAVLALGGAGALALVAVPLAAVLAIFSAAGLPYVGALLASGVLATLWLRRPRPRRDWLRPAVVGVATLGVLSIPALRTLGTFLNTATAGYTGAHPTAPLLGPLLRPLPISEISGVWLYGDYRLPVPGGIAGDMTVLATVVVFVLLIPAVARMVMAREPGPLMGLFTMGLVLLIVYPRVTPYAQAKLLMIASPAVVLAALQALSWARLLRADPGRAGGKEPRPVWTLVGAAAAVALGGAIIASDALAYHDAPVAPTKRFQALAQIGAHLGNGGPVLDSEFEQFAKYLMLPARVIDGPDAPTPVELALRTPAAEYDQSFDLNDELLPFVESFPYVLTSRAPASSRPPSNYRLEFGNAFYELWVRGPRPRVYAHLPVSGDLFAAAPRVGCRSLRSMVSVAPPRTALAVASVPTTYGFGLADAIVRSPSWVPGGHTPGGFTTTTAGAAYGRITVARGGLYEAWVQGNLPRAVSVTLDGRTLGRAHGNSAPAGWVSAGLAVVSSGSHLLGVVRPGVGLDPGNGNTQGEIDAVALSAAHERSQVSVTPLASWRSLCGKVAAWVEVVAR